jgi:hypothetical protein
MLVERGPICQMNFYWEERVVQLLLWVLESWVFGERVVVES